jgi:hypothetical protein
LQHGFGDRIATERAFIHRLIISTEVSPGNGKGLLRLNRHYHGEIASRNARDVVYDGDTDQIAVTAIKKAETDTRHGSTQHHG